MTNDTVQALGAPIHRIHITRQSSSGLPRCVVHTEPKSCCALFVRPFIGHDFIHDAIQRHENTLCLRKTTHSLRVMSYMTPYTLLLSPDRTRARSALHPFCTALDAGSATPHSTAPALSAACATAPAHEQERSQDTLHLPLPSHKRESTTPYTHPPPLPSLRWLHLDIYHHEPGRQDPPWYPRHVSRPQSPRHRAPGSRKGGVAWSGWWQGKKTQPGKESPVQRLKKVHGEKKMKANG